MKKALVATYCTWMSYGSVLQAYALKKFLKTLDVDSFIVLDSQDFQTPYTKVFSRNPKIMVKCLYEWSHGSKRYDRYVKSMRFIAQNIDIQRFDSIEEIEKSSFDADICIAGSDQVFHPDLCSPLFFLECFPSKMKKVSYAASMGITNIKKEKEDAFKRLVNNFDRISVREKDNVNVIKKYYNRDVCVNIDPTFLVSASEWRKLEKEYDIKNKFILVYPIYWEEGLNRQLRELKKKTGYDIITVKNGFIRVYGDKIILDAGINEFIWLVDHAEAVITSSFHGVAMASILNKDFSVVVNPKAPSRILSLLEMLNIKPLTINRLIDYHMDYSLTDEKINKEKLRAIEYFNEVLNNE